MKLYLQILLFLGATFLGGHGLAALSERLYVNDAIRQAVRAKSEYCRLNHDNTAALDAYDEAPAQSRLDLLADAGLLSLQAEAFVTDPGALDESPVGHYPTGQNEADRPAQPGFLSAMR